jgi:4-hydroxy-4-methyl-2-oxoglutarate aldolase
VAAGAVNLPVTIGGTRVAAGDVIVADDDGVVRVPRMVAGEVLRAAQARVTEEAKTRRRLADGELSLDLFDLRRVLNELGVAYRRWEEESAAGGAPV